MYSRGSVIPLFLSQLQQGQPLTITDPSMTRFLMSLQESVDLVQHAFAHAEPGDLFVRKAPAATVEVLARAVASLVGDDDPDIRVIGTRHGEKRHETLLSSEEMLKSTDQGDYFKVPLDARGLEYELFYEEGETEAARVDDYTSANTEQLDVEQTKALLVQLPEVEDLLERAAP
jgi:UDP-glucose 4-epimerase